MKIRKAVYEKLIFESPVAPPETGGIIGGDNGIIDCFKYVSGQNSESIAFYSPDVDEMNRLISEWNKKSIEFYGVFHSHPFCCPMLTNEDKIYASEIMKAMPSDISFLYFPIIIPKEKIVFYKAIKFNGNVKFIFENVIVTGGEFDGKDQRT